MTSALLGVAVAFESILIILIVLVILPFLGLLGVLNIFGLLGGSFGLGCFALLLDPCETFLLRTCLTLLSAAAGGDARFARDEVFASSADIGAFAGLGDVSGV